MKKLVLSAILGCGLLGNAFAAGDADAGKTKAATCAACHGANGIGIADNYPNLAGQHADYIVKQLKAFKDGSRVDPVMAPMAMPLSEQDMLDLGAYFGSLSLSGDAPAAGGEGETAAAAPAPAAPQVVADPVAGKGLYEDGDVTRGITACVDCHGKEGNSEVLINPNLSNQHPEYIEKQLKAFHAGDRVDASMNAVAMNLTEQDILDLGAYFKAPEAVADVVASKPSAEKLTFVGDADAGEAKAMVCAACHGADGNQPLPNHPKLAGQHESYLVKQLQDFKSGDREDAIMAGQVAGLSDDDMQNLAAYFASKKVTPVTAEANEVGKKLYQGGDAARGITACIACHGTDGKGAGLAGFPKVGSQTADYTKVQLEKFRSGVRNNDMNSMMANIAAKLTDEDIAALAEYMASLK
ncbi:c-type cytochrome [Thalassotalea sp. HSM 43]|uniref:c-type cytochrome n=1 Tax=Thalassotalea sp. HSM 43 TaxID=2552945 RepID=UPI0026BF236D